MDMARTKTNPVRNLAKRKQYFHENLDIAKKYCYFCGAELEYNYSEEHPEKFPNNPNACGLHIDTEYMFCCGDCNALIVNTERHLQSALFASLDGNVDLKKYHISCIIENLTKQIS